VDKKLIEEGVRLILEGIGEDISREGLKRTPQRVADMYEELFNGIGKDPAAELEPLFDENHDEMIIVKDIPFYSVCEHHLVPFVGKAHIAYVPNKSGKIVGLSKLSRVLDVVSRRLQVQERLTTIVADTIMKKLQPRGTMVIIEAEHLCLAMRGVQKGGATMVTSSVLGTFRTTKETRDEFMAHLERPAPRV